MKFLHIKKSLIYNYLFLMILPFSSRGNFFLPLFDWGFVVIGVVVNTTGQLTWFDGWFNNINCGGSCKIFDEKTPKLDEAEPKLMISLRPAIS